MTDALPGWANRQPDFANLFNPAFVGIVLRSVCEGYVARADEAMPVSLSFLAVPLVLSPAVRQNRPSNVRARMGKWLRENPNIKAEFMPAARFLVPVVREAIMVAVYNKLLAIESHRLRGIGHLQSALGTPDASPISNLGNDLAHARFIGRWLAATGSEVAIFDAIGLRP